MEVVKRPCLEDRADPIFCDADYTLGYNDCLEDIKHIIEYLEKKITIEENLRNENEKSI
jgi:hypothetical protein